MRRKWRWTDAQIDKLNKVIAILDELSAYKPLTLRQVYYQLVGKGFIENKVSQYTMLSNMLKWARIDGHISWDDIEDRTRTFHDLSGWPGRDVFIKRSVDCFLNGYRRDLLQSQERRVEVWIEKDALSALFVKFADPYTVPVVVCKGFVSVSLLNSLKWRVSHYGKTVVLYFGDFDPSGMEMLKSMQTTCEDELGLTGVQFKRVALEKDDIFKYRLPHDPSALKKKDTRSARHVERFGELAVEIDALSPGVLKGKVEKAIENELDIDLLNTERQRHEQDLNAIQSLKESVACFVDNWVSR